MGGSWCVLLWFHRSFSCSAAMAGGVPSSITVFKGGGEGGRSRSSKSLLRESSGQLVLMETILVLLPMCLYGLGVCRSWWGLCQVHQQCQQGHLTSGRSTQEQPDSAALSACPCRAGVLLSLFRLETLKMTPSSSPQSPQLSWAALGRVVPVDAGRGPTGCPSLRAPGPQELLSPASCDAWGGLVAVAASSWLSPAPRLLPGHRSLCHRR